MTENELKTFVLRAAKTYGWMVYHVPQATMHNGGGKGYPDLTLAKMGRPPLWIELKQQGAKLTPEQDEWHLALSPRAYVIRPRDIENGVLMDVLREPVLSVPFGEGRREKQAVGRPLPTYPALDAAGHCQCALHGGTCPRKLRKGRRYCSSCIEYCR